MDLGDVRVHHDTHEAANTAREVQASAYTVGQHIVFGAGKYAPSSSTGREMLAHELSHVAQQRDVTVPSGPLPVSRPSDPDEVAAHETARALLAGQPVSLGAATSQRLGLHRDFDSTIRICHRVLESRRFHVSNGQIQVLLHATWQPSDEDVAQEAAHLTNAPPYYYVSLRKEGWLLDDEIATEPVPLGRSVMRSWSDLSDGDYYLFFWTDNDYPYRCLAGEVSVTTPASAPAAATPATSAEACFDGDMLYVHKGSQSSSVPALTGTVGDPTPEGDYGMRRQGEAQIAGGIKGRLFQQRDRWFLLEPMFPTTRYRMQLHPGTMSSGCITVMDSVGFDRIAGVLNSGGTTTITGTDGYPPGNPSGTEVAPKPVQIVGTLHVAYGVNGCVPGIPAGSSGGPATPQLSRTPEATPRSDTPEAPHLARSPARLARYPDPPAAVSIPSPLPLATTVTSPTVSTTRPDGSAIPGGWTIGASGPNAAPSRIGTVERVPIEGLPGNKQQQANLPDGTPADSFPTSTAIGPRMAEGAGRAVALVPDSVRTGGPGPVDVLLHLHGLGGGMRRRTGDPTDVGAYDMPQQIQAFLTSRPGERLIALMPIGVSVAPSQTTDKEGNVHWAFHNTSFGVLDPDTFIRVCFTRLAGSLPSGAMPGRVILSAHSGGGLEISRMIAANRLPSNFAGVFSFESIHSDLPTWTTFVLGHLDADLTELQRLQTTTPDPALLLQAQQNYLTGSGFRFVAMARSVSDYGARVRAVRAAIVDWFGRHASDLSTATGGQNSVQDLLWANYQAVAASPGDHTAALATAQHNLGRALATLPPPAAPPGVGTTTTTTTTTPPPAATPGVQRLARQAATTGIGAADAAMLLTDAAVAMGRSDATTVSPDQDHTRLRRDDISAALAGHATNHDLNQAFTSGVAAIAAASEADRPAVVQRWARTIRFVLETQFVHEPTRSGLDLLDPASAARYRGFHWEPADYPGSPTGPNEGVARSMARAMAAIVPERRPNIGVANVMTSAELTAKARANIIANLVEVPGQPHQRLLAPAARAFDSMQTIAGTFNGVDLSINNSFRSFATAQAHAAAAANPMAVASFSSHSLGLAVDFNLTAGGQHFAEVTTTPMQNVSNMRSSPTYKWMVLHGEEFGWYPFGDEPWHWEYNPPGFRDVFRGLVFPHLSTSPSVLPASGATASPAS